MSDSTNQSGPGLVTEDRSRQASYRVLARKYRPATFDDLIGQDAMVRTVSNAFETARIPQAWILTGVRGVGKTTTARILARALNYELPDGSITAPTIKMPVIGMHCHAIMESRHIDVIEMDAASHNSVDDVRQINDAIRYAPVSARYKVYILDEVHMLSTQAFNALLKTLEEPPPHAKFIFATTEIRKVPITILSRCQRFDLRRVDADLLVKHLETIAGKEGIEVEPAAFALVARAAEGSVRDALSLLDQAIAHAAGPVRAEDVRQMLGLADRVRVIELFEALMRGDIAAALTELRAQYDTGADPAVVLTDLADFTHFVTRVKIVPAVADDRSLIEIERARGRACAEKLSMRVLSRTWQMLLKGIAEVDAAGRPLAAAEMVLVRIAHAADLPTPDEVIRSLDENGSGSRARASAASPAPAPAAPRFEAPRVEASRGAPRAALAPSNDPVARAAEAQPSAPALAIAGFEDLIALAAQKRDLSVKLALERDVRLVRCEDGRLEIALEPTAAKTLVNDLARKFSQWTNRRWMVVVSAEDGEPTVRSQNDARQAALKTGVRGDPLVQAVLARFPGAEIVDVREGAAALPQGLPSDESEDKELAPEDNDAGFGAQFPHTSSPNEAADEA
ncbi:MAG TPA: DNA polymerase III subunit gamma/tau [Xanthobacteraceae bacterium]|nr:DNA polymerase III subunit gamma/tau [Xanthobacteraceae bacterium]